VRTLEINAPAHQLIPVLSLPVLGIGELEELILDMTGNVSCFRNHTCNPVFSAAINLKTVKINSEFPLTVTHPGELVVLQWQSLRHVELTNIVCINPAIVNELLSRCSNLEYLKFDGVVTPAWGPKDTIFGPAAVCKHLKELHLSFLGPNGAKSVFAVVTCPVLEVLSIKHPNTSPAYAFGEIGEVLLSFYVRSRFPLRELSLERIENFNEKHLEPFLQCVGKTLESLSISVCNWIDMTEFFTMLRADVQLDISPTQTQAMPRPLLLPKLSTLSIILAGAFFPNPGAYIIPMLSSRGWDSGWRDLSRVVMLRNVSLDLGANQLETNAMRWFEEKVRSLDGEGLILRLLMRA